jgi:ribonuclease HII
MNRRVEPQRHPDLAFEFALQQGGCVHVAGIDEAGRGAWAGPVVAAAVVLPLDRFDLASLLDGVRDSKAMTPNQRQKWASCITRVALSVGIGRASHEEVDQLGLITATRSAMARALTDLCILPEHLLIDHLLIPEIPLPQTALTHGDSRALSIAAASVLAKVSRDRTMIRLDEDYPGYGFAHHKGYGTARHRAALQSLGPCPIHRRTYAPVAALASNAHSVLFTTQRPLYGKT